jgi:hypothetical protein
MADSYRLTTLKRLTALLEATTVTPVTGIQLPSTLTGLVYRGRGRFGDDSPETMLSVLEAPRNGGGLFAGESQARKETWPLLIQGWCPEDHANPSDPIYSLLDDVERQLDRIVRKGGGTGYPLYPEHYLLGPGLGDDKWLITDFQAGPGTVRPPTENISSKCWFYIAVQVGLARIAP